MAVYFIFSPACFLPPGYFLKRPCGNQMGTKFWEVVCDEHGIGGSCEYCGDNGAHLGRVNVFYHEALGGEYVPCAVLFDLKPGVIDAANPNRRSASTSARTTPCTIRVGNNWDKGHHKRVKHQFF
jgi:tubulin beta